MPFVPFKNEITLLCCTLVTNACFAVFITVPELICSAVPEIAPLLVIAPVESIVVVAKLPSVFRVNSCNLPPRFEDPPD